MLKPNALIRGMLFVVVWGLVVASIGSFFYAAYELFSGNFRHPGSGLVIPGLGWQVPLFIVFGLAANGVAAVARALGMDFGDFGSVSVTHDCGGDDWDD